MDATSKGELKTDVSLVETGVSLIDGTTPGIEYIKRTTAVNSIESDEPAAESNLWFAIQHPQTALFHKLFDKDRPTLKIRFTLDNVPLTSQSSRYSSHGL